MNKEFTKKVIVYLLVALAIVLGFFIYKKDMVQTSVKNIDTNEPQKINSELFSQDQKKLLVPPGANASKEEIDEHSKLAAKLSIAGEKVVINDCKAEPLVLRTGLGSSVIFENIGVSNISISFDDKNQIEIPAGKSVASKEAFVHGAGLYGYLCTKDNFKGLIGFVILTQ